MKERPFNSLWLVLELIPLSFLSPKPSEIYGAINRSNDV